MRKQPAKPNSPFDGYITRLRQSRNRLQRRSIYLGQIHPHGYPVLLDSSLLCNHPLILGVSGSDKGEPPTDAASDSIAPSGGGSVIVLDLKGDTALFDTARIEARRAGRRFTRSPLPS